MTLKSIHSSQHKPTSYYVHTQDKCQQEEKERTCLRLPWTSILSHNLNTHSIAPIHSSMWHNSSTWHHKLP